MSSSSSAPSEAFVPHDVLRTYHEVCMAREKMKEAQLTFQAFTVNYGITANEIIRAVEPLVQENEKRLQFLDECKRKANEARAYQAEVVQLRRRLDAVETRLLEFMAADTSLPSKRSDKDMDDTPALAAPPAALAASAAAKKAAVSDSEDYDDALVYEGFDEKQEDQ